jgi:hypothetical protein
LPDGQVPVVAKQPAALRESAQGLLEIGRHG